MRITETHTFESGEKNLKQYRLLNNGRKDVVGLVLRERVTHQLLADKPRIKLANPKAKKAKLVRKQSLRKEKAK